MKIEPFLAELRQAFDAPEFLENLEKVVKRQPNLTEYLAKVRERMKQVAALRAEREAKAQAAAGH